MKSRYPLFSFFVLQLAGGAFAEEVSPPAGDPAATRFAGPLVINNFTPPLPPLPKQIPAMRVEGASVRQLPGYRISVLLGEPSALPDLPREAPRPPLTDEELARRDAFHARHRPERHLYFSASTYSRRISLVQWRHPDDSSMAYEAIISIDFGIFSNVGRYFHQGVPHNLFVMNHDIDSAALRRVSGGWSVPELPAGPEGSYVVTRGDAQDAAGMHPLHSLLDLFAAEKETLLEARVKRLQYESDARRWRERNPPSKAPVSATWWLRLHRGSRYIEK